MKAEITINMNNDAFASDNSAIEVARVLRGISEKLLSGEYPPIILRDMNGNRVGKMKIIF